MTDDQGPTAPAGIHLADMNGRIEELERQRDAALSRCAILAGSNALLRKTLAEALTEIERLNGLIAELPGSAPAQVQAPVFN